MNKNSARRPPPLGAWWTVIGTALLVAAVGCRRSHEGTEGGTTMVEGDPAVSTALARMEATGKLEGVEFEIYAGGGLPPPYYVSNQLLFLARDGHDTLQFVTPNYSKKPAKDEAYPSDVYRLPAQPADVKAIARVLREGRAFTPSPPGPTVADAVRTELVLTIAGKEHKAVYRGLPPALAPLGVLFMELTARAKAQGQHELEP